MNFANGPGHDPWANAGTFVFTLSRNRNGTSFVDPGRSAPANNFGGNNGVRVRGST